MLLRVHLQAIKIIGALEWTIPLLKRQSPGNTTESNAELILRLIESGQVGVNEGVITTEVAPFGGVKESGYGHEGGIEGLEVYTNRKFISQA